MKQLKPYDYGYAYSYSGDAASADKWLGFAQAQLYQMIKMDVPYKLKYYNPESGVEIWIYIKPNKIQINAAPNGLIYVTLEDVNSGPGSFKYIFDAKVISTGLPANQVYASYLRPPLQLYHKRFLYPSPDLTKTIDMPVTGTDEYFAGEQYWYDTKHSQVLSWRLAPSGSVTNTYCFYYGGKWGLTTDITASQLQTACIVKINSAILTRFPSASIYSKIVIAIILNGSTVSVALYGYSETSTTTFNLINLGSPFTFSAAFLLISEFTADATKVATVNYIYDSYGLATQKVDIYSFTKDYASYTKTTPMNAAVQGNHVTSSGSGGSTIPTPALLTGNWNWNWTYSLVGGVPSIIKIRAEGNLFSALAQNYSVYSFSEAGTATQTTGGGSTTKSTSSSGSYSFTLALQILNISTTGYSVGFTTPSMSGGTTLNAAGNFVTASGATTSSGTEAIVSTGHSNGNLYPGGQGIPISVLYFSAINNSILYLDAFPANSNSTTISGGGVGHPTVLSVTPDHTITYTYKLATKTGTQIIYSKTSLITYSYSFNTFTSTDHIDPWRAVSNAAGLTIPERAFEDPATQDYITSIASLPFINYASTDNGRAHSDVNLSFTDKVAVFCFGTLPFTITDINATVHGPYTYADAGTAYIDPVKKTFSSVIGRIDTDSNGITYPLSATHK